MTASTGSENWISNWKGQGDITSMIKVVDATIYDKDNKRLPQKLPKGTSVTYIDNQSKEYSKVAIRVGQDIFFTRIDNLIKPKTLGAVNLKPQAFGLGAPLSLTSYVSTLKKSIKNRNNIKGELQEYLLDLVDYVFSGSGGLVGFKFNELPMTSIRNDFGEVLGPIFCLRSGLINLNLGVNASSTISFPASGAEPLLDYFINTPTKQIKVSAKAKGTSNTLKMSALVPAVLNDSKLSIKHANSLEFRLMSAINSNSINMGAIECALLIGAISPQAAGSVRGLRGNDTEIPNPQLFIDLISNESILRSKQKFTLREIAYACEKKVVEFSRKTMVSKKLTEIVKDILDNEIFFVKLDIDNGIPRFNIVSTSDRTISNLVFRNKNDTGRASDRLGFKL